MRYSLRSDRVDSTKSLATEIANAIGTRVVSVLPDTEAEVRTRPAGEGEEVAELRLNRNGFPIPFATIIIDVEKEGPVLSLEISAEQEIINIPEDIKSGGPFVDEIMQRYAGLRPIVTESISHKYGVVEGNELDPGRRKATRALKITFGILERECNMQKEGGSYDFDEIAGTIVPYVKALYEIGREFTR